MADLYNDTKALESKDFVLIGVASGADTQSQIATFQDHYGLDDVVIWVDTEKHYADIVDPGQPNYPIEVVLDREGVIRYVATDYHPGAAVEAAKPLL